MFSGKGPHGFGAGRPCPVEATPSRAAVPESLDQRTFVVIRDPRDTLVSWYFSLMYSHDEISQTIVESRKELRDRGARHPGSPRQLRARKVLAGDRTQREVLRHRQRRLVRRKEPFDPSSRERRYGGQRLSGIGLNAARSGQ